MNDSMYGDNVKTVFRWKQLVTFDSGNTVLEEPPAIDGLRECDGLNPIDGFASRNDAINRFKSICDKYSEDVDGEFTLIEIFQVINHER